MSCTLNLVRIIKVVRTQDLQQVFAVRTAVFVKEQNCPTDLEWEFEDESVHFLALVNDEPAGAARWRKTDQGFKLERFAVLKGFRGIGVGEALVKAVLADLPQEAKVVYLHAQLHAVGFYEKLNFVKEGPEFEEAGIMHYKMRLQTDATLS